MAGALGVSPGSATPQSSRTIDDCHKLESNSIEANDSLRYQHFGNIRNNDNIIYYNLSSRWRKHAIVEIRLETCSGLDRWHELCLPLSLVTIPILFLYMVQTCPEESTFDAKLLAQTYCGGHFYEYSEYYIVRLW